MEKYAGDFDYFCAGSDQIWNTALVQDRDFFFMNFAPSEKTFSLSASMGTTYIAQEYKELYIKGFKHVGNISVREADVKELINNLVNKSAEVLLDPTMLIDKEKWISIATKPKFDLNDKYIATYFLSNLTKEQQSFIEEYAKENDLKIIDLNGSYYNYVGPLEFLYLLSNAQFVFTDSFHGTVFSIIFNKQFVVFQRNNMYDMSSRITTILSKFKMDNRFYNNPTIDNSLISLINDIKNESTEHVNNIIKNEQNKAKGFLEKVFKK